MYRWGMALAIMLGVWLGALLPVLMILLVALCLARQGRLAWLGLPVACLYGVWQLQAVMLQQLPVALEGQTLTFTGTVVSLPETRKRQRFSRLQQEQHFTFLTDDHPQWRGNHRIRVSSFDSAVVVPGGARLQVDLKLKASRGRYNATGMDLTRHDLANGVAARATLKQVSVLDDGSGLHHWRQRESGLIREGVMSSPLASAVLPALVVGDRSGLTPERLAAFQVTGAAHLLAISGLHVAIVAGAVWWLSRVLLAPLCHWLWPFSRRCTQQQLAWGPALIIAVGYSALAGFSVPTQRALIMLFVVALCVWMRRQGHLLGNLGWALLLVLLLDPLAALSESLWLSFAAVAVIAVLMTGYSGRGLMLLLPILMTLLSAALFGQWSVLAPLANLILIPLYSLLIIPLTLLGAVTGAEVLLEGAGTGVELSICIMQLLSRWSGPIGAYLPLPTLPSALCLMVGVFLLLLPAVPFPRWLLPLWLLPWLSQSPQPLIRGQWELTAFDVGQGLALAVRTQDHLLLYDTGASWSDGSMARSIILPWLSRNRLSPDLLVLSHGDNDHAGGSMDFPVEIPRLSGEPHRVPGSRACLRGDAWNWDGVSFKVLWPEHAGYRGNDASCVIRVEGNGRSVLLPGDISQDVEHRLLGRWPGVDLLVLAHHGSKSSTSAALLREINPQWALVSAGYRHHFGHPHREVMSRLAASGITVMRTDEDGMIVFRGDGPDNDPLITKWRHKYARPWQYPAGWRFW